MESILFSSIKIGDVEFKNRIFMSPMCQYSAKEGLLSEWHRTHYVSRAIGGVGGIIIEATAVEPRGMISPFDLGLYNEKQKGLFKELCALVKQHGSKIGIQLAHSGRKGSKDTPWRNENLLTKSEGGYDVIAPSAIAFDENYAKPKQMVKEDIDYVRSCFVNSARMAQDAGFDFVELHMAHGYLMHQFLSPLSNKREDKYGGDFENRIRFPLETAMAVREALKGTPLFVRISATDWAEGGWNLEQSIEFSKRLKSIGVNLIDVSSGGLVNYASIPSNFGYQVGFAAKIKQSANIPVSGLGLIVNPYQAEHILVTQQADIIVMGRALLSDPYWPLHAAKTLGLTIEWPSQYERAHHV